MAAQVGIDRRALGAFRIALGAVLLLDLALRSRSLVAFYTDAGVLPRSTLTAVYPVVGRLSLHALSGAAWVQVALFVLAAGAAVSLLVGYRSRLAAGMSLVLLLSLHARNPLVLNAGDSLLRQLLFWGLFLPLGARWGVDARRASTSGNRLVSLATAAVLLQVVVVYAVNAAVKFRGGRWLEGTALPYVFSLDRFTILLGDSIAELPWLLAILERGWLAMLVLSPLLLVLRGRPRAIFAGLFVLAHLGMALTLALGVFPLVSIAALLLFVPAPYWDGLQRRVVTPLGSRISAVRSGRFHQTGPGESSSWMPRVWRRRIHRTATVVVAIGLVVMLGYNAVTVATGSFASDDEGLDVGEPRWRMFAPNPPSTDGWYVVPGALAGGGTIDAFHGGPVTWDRPRDLAATYPSARWRKYLTNLRWTGDAQLARSFADHVCWRWRDRGLTAIEVYFLAEPTTLSGPEPVERRLLGQFDCRAVSRT